MRDPVIEEPDDVTLAVQAGAGDTEAFAVLVRRHQTLAVRTAALAGAPDDAEDAAQDAFVKAYRALDRYRPELDFRPWLMAIVRNEARNRRRGALRFARLRRRAAAMAPVLPQRSTEEVVLAHQRRLATAEAVARLPEHLRLVVTCRYLLELSEAETADALGCPVGTVKSRLARGLDKLRTDLSADPAEGVITCRPTTR
ncbi:MAG: sigma-70 family RNA polymerase sigma factor [Nocardioidaceae bacterium]